MRAAVAAQFGRAIVLCALAGLPPVALADDVHCPPHLGEVKIDGNVLVAAPCQLNGTIVIGNVHLYAGGSLVTRGATRIDGSIQAENADFVDLAGTHVNGSIQLDDLVGDRSIILDSSIGGSIQLAGNRSRLEVLGNTVTADVQAFSNAGGVLVADNAIDGNLQCKSNDPVPVGGNNRVQGNMEDQCANLRPEDDAPAPPPPPAPPPAPAPAEPTSTAGGGGGGGFGLPVLLLATVFAYLAARRGR